MAPSALPRCRPMASRSAWSIGACVIDPGWFFRISAVITLTGGTILLMWLGEQITSRGVGNGISLIIFAGIVARFPDLHLADCSNRPHRRDRPPLIFAFMVAPSAWWALHRLHGARAAPAARAISQASGRQPHVRRRIVASAAEAQRVGRHSADLCVVDPADADDRRGLLRAERAGLAADGVTYIGPASRSISSSTR
jgi:hypothetical protein